MAAEGVAVQYDESPHLKTYMQTQKILIEKWCQATVEDAVKLFHKARRHPDNEAESLARIAIRCANSAFEYVSPTIIGDRDATAKLYGEMCYARFQDEIQRVVCEPTVEELVN